MVVAVDGWVVNCMPPILDTLISTAARLPPREGGAGMEMSEWIGVDVHWIDELLGGEERGNYSGEETRVGVKTKSIQVLPPLQ